MLIDKVKKTIQKYDLIAKNERIVVGVSGGPDSLALLYVLNSLSQDLQFSLHIAHLDHMLRCDSDKDKEFVAEIARGLEIPFTNQQINVKRLARRGSLEEIARNARLKFLFRVAKKIGARKIALGHHLDDQAETVLMRILRGSGLYGLCGILPKRNIAGYQIVRPLIEVSRRDIQSFLRRKGLRPRLDTSNSQDVYLRNRIRNRLLPLLEKEYNKNIKNVLANLAQTSADDYHYLFVSGNRLLSKTGLRVELKKIVRLHPAMHRMVLRLMIVKAKGDLRQINFKHIEELRDLIYHRPVNSIVDLPKGLSVVKKPRAIYFYKRRKP